VEAIAQSAVLPVAPVCNVLEVSRSAYYAWRRGSPSSREERDQELAPMVQSVFWKHKRRDGARRIAQELSDRGQPCSPRRAANCYDNAFMESCFGTIKTELEMTEYENHRAAGRAIAEYIHYYQTERKHSALGYLIPIQFEGR
jgi:transposase InsO family protein